MRPPHVTGLTLLSLLALGACSASGGASGTGGTGGTGGGAGASAAARAPAAATSAVAAAANGGAARAPAARSARAAAAPAARPARAAAPPARAARSASPAPPAATARFRCARASRTASTATLWKTTKAGDATIAVDDVHAARGTKALHVKTTAGGGSNFAYIKETKTFPATNNVLYGRMFVWFEDALTTDGHFSLAEGAGTGTPAVIRFGGQFKAFGVGTDGGSSGDWTDSDRTKLVPTQTWICAEFQFDGPTNTFHVWWDDMERPTLTSGPSKHASFTMPTFNSLWFGWWMYNLAEPQEIWIDEIAVDYKPIGCTK